MGAHPYQASHLAELLDELIAYFRARPVFGCLADALGGQLQELEESVRELREERTLDVAIGAQLDQWGVLVGEPRGALGDDDYRRFIAARILANTAQGVPDRLITILGILAENAILPGNWGLFYTPKYPAGYTLAVLRDFPALSADVRSRIAGIFDAITPAGVQQVLIDASFTADGPFRFDIGPGFDVGEFASLID